jgi:molybdopterin-guanine dinucleotide biosynthesis protein A
LLERVARTLEPLCCELLFACGAEPRLGEVVGGPQEGRGADRAHDVPRRMVLDEEPGQGPLAGLLAGLSAARAEWVAVSACDLPRLETELFRLLLSRAQERDDDVCLFVGRSGEQQAPRWHPSIGVYRSELADCVRRTLRLGGRRWIDFHHVPVEGVRLPRVGTLSERELPVRLREALVARNLNDPRDYDAERAYALRIPREVAG